MVALETPVDVGGVRLRNRLYRAPLLECAGNGPDAAETLREELAPAAAAGAGLVCQGATVVRGDGGCAAPGMTRVHDPEFVAGLSAVADAIHDHDGAVFCQLEHGGLRSMETWHAGYRDAHPDLRQLAVSRPPGFLRVLDRVGFLDYEPRVMSADDVYDLAADFGRSAEWMVDAGYDGVHLAGANMGVVQQFLSPYYNRRSDEFGGSVAARTRFLEVVLDEIRERVGESVPVVTKVPAETEAPPFVRRRISLADGVEIATRLADAGFDALAPVCASTFWDMSIVRGEYPARAWRDDRFESGYASAFGSRLRARVVAALNRVESLRYGFEPAWNAEFCRRVSDRVDVPVMCEGGVRDRDTIDRLLGEGISASDRGERADGSSERRSDGVCDVVGMGRPFYAEPRLPARILDADPDAAVACENCNNCTVPQVTGADGVCRTPSVLEERGRRQRRGEYDRDGG